MNKSLILLLLICIMLFSSCLSKPIEKQPLDLYQNIATKSVSLNTENPQIKIYFPSFMTIDESKKHKRMVWGDGIILFLPDGKVMMVDCFDSEGQEQLLAFMESLGITTIDYFFATHNHTDHVGNVPILLNHFTIKNYYWNGVHFDSFGDAFVTEILEDNKIEPIRLEQGDSLTICESPECKIDVLWPKLTDQDIYDAFNNPGRTQRLKNNTSLVFKLTYNDFSVLFTGDLYKQGDEVLTKTYGSALKSTVLKVPHHGEFYTSNNLAFAKAVSPEIAIMQDNQYVKYPISNFGIYRIYKKIKSKFLFRNSAGYILVTSDGKNYSVKEKTFTEQN